MINVQHVPGEEEGDRQRVLIGGGQPSRRILAADNILYEVPLELGYSAPYNDAAGDSHG